MTSSMQVKPRAEPEEVMACSNHGYPLISEKAIGIGQFSRVFLGELGLHNITEGTDRIRLLQPTKQTVAIKVIYLDVGYKILHHLSNMVSREVGLLNESLRNPHVVRLLDVFIHCKRVFIVTEWAEQGSLELLLDLAEDNRMNENDARCLFRQVVFGVYNLHVSGIAHRNLNISNVLVDVNGCVKLAGFGFAIKSNKTKRGYNFLAKTVTAKTYTYLAPEVLSRTRRCRSEYDPKATDLWSLGILLYRLVHGYLPFVGVTKKTILKCQDTFFNDKEKLNFDEGISQLCRELILSLLQKNPAKRMKPKDLLCSTWLKKNVSEPLKCAHSYDRCVLNMIKKIDREDLCYSSRLTRMYLRRKSNILRQLYKSKLKSGCTAERLTKMCVSMRIVPNAVVHQSIPWEVWRFTPSRETKQKGILIFSEVDLRQVQVISERGAPASGRKSICSSKTIMSESLSLRSDKKKQRDPNEELKNKRASSLTSRESPPLEGVAEQHNVKEDFSTTANDLSPKIVDPPEVTDAVLRGKITKSVENFFDDGLHQRCSSMSSNELTETSSPLSGVMDDWITATICGAAKQLTSEQNTTSGSDHGGTDSTAEEISSLCSESFFNLFSLSSVTSLATSHRSKERGTKLRDLATLNDGRTTDSASRSASPMENVDDAGSEGNRVSCNRRPTEGDDDKTVSGLVGNRSNLTTCLTKPEEDSELEPEKLSPIAVITGLRNEEEEEDIEGNSENASQATSNTFSTSVSSVSSEVLMGVEFGTNHRCSSSPGPEQRKAKRGVKNLKKTKQQHVWPTTLPAHPEGNKKEENQLPENGQANVVNKSSEMPLVPCKPKETNQRKVQIKKEGSFLFKLPRPKSKVQPIMCSPLVTKDSQNAPTATEKVEQHSRKSYLSLLSCCSKR